MNKICHSLNSLIGSDLVNIDKNALTSILQLIRLTSQDKIVWQIEDPPLIFLCEPNSRIPLFMTIRQKCQQIALYQHQYRLFDIDYRQYFWSEKVILAILDISGCILLEEREQTPAIFKLFEMVRRKVYGIDIAEPIN